MRDDASSSEHDGKPVTNAFTSVDDTRDAHSYEDLPRSLLIKTDLRLIPTLAFSASTLLAALADRGSVRHESD